MASYNFVLYPFEAKSGSGVGEYATVSFVYRRRYQIPKTHLEDSSKLEADAYVEFFQILLSDKTTTLYVKINETVTWQNHEYQGTGIKMSGVSQFSDDESSRPTLMLFNPGKVYSALVDQGLLEGGMLTRYRVLKQHVESNAPIFTRQRWKISRVASLRGDTITCELRDMIDGQNFTVPARMYTPPEFPAVSI